jgi:hypothetical protein
MSESKTIYQKLLAAKKDFTAISKDHKNPHFKSEYYDINDIHKMVDPIFHEHGLMVLNPIVEGKMVTQIVDVETGDKLESSFKIEYNANPQKVGSEITYLRRYLLSSLIGLKAEDDDGNLASKNPPPTKATQAVAKPKIKEMKAAKEALSKGKVTVSQLFEKYDLTLEQIADFNEVITKKQ